MVKKMIKSYEENMKSDLNLYNSFFMKNKRLSLWITVCFFLTAKENNAKILKKEAFL